MKNVLVTTDFSPLADAAIGFAADLVRGSGAELTLVHVITEDRPAEPDPDAPMYKVAKRVWDADQAREKETRQQLEERARRLHGVKAFTAIGRGPAVEGILAVARDVGADLLVISSSGRTGVQRLLLGSVAEELARSSPVPVLIYKSKPVS